MGTGRRFGDSVATEAVGVAPSQASLHHLGRCCSRWPAPGDAHYEGRRGRAHVSVVVANWMATAGPGTERTPVYNPTQRGRARAARYKLPLSWPILKVAQTARAHNCAAWTYH